LPGWASNSPFSCLGFLRTWDHRCAPPHSASCLLLTGESRPGVPALAGEDPAAQCPPAQLQAADLPLEPCLLFPPLLP
jgi:hypothetical protein